MGLAREKMFHKRERKQRDRGQCERSIHTRERTRMRGQDRENKRDKHGVTSVREDFTSQENKYSRGGISIEERFQVLGFRRDKHRTCLRREGPFSDGVIDSAQILPHNPTSSDVHVTDFGVTHLTIGKPTVCIYYVKAKVTRTPQMMMILMMIF